MIGELQKSILNGIEVVTTKSSIHRDGAILVDVWTGSANSTRTLRYNFVAGDVIENDVRDANYHEDRIAWIDDVVSDSIVEIESINDIPEAWTNIAEEELRWLNFEVKDKPHKWHYHE